MYSSRRQFFMRPLGGLLDSISRKRGDMRFGLVTYLWGRDWDISTLIRNCQNTGVEGVELRTEHAHGVEVHLSAAERAAVQSQFMDSDVRLVGLGTNWSFHHLEAARQAHAISQAKASIILAHDVGASGVKVKPDALPDGISEEQTIAQIARALRTLGRFGEDYGQEIRLEVHGYRTDALPVIRQIMEATRHHNVRVCWNCNEADLHAPGLAHNFELVRGYLAQTAHVRELNSTTYPYRQLFELFARFNYAGWILLEARTDPPDRIAALRQQRSLFDSLIRLSERN